MRSETKAQIILLLEKELRENYSKELATAAKDFVLSYGDSMEIFFIFSTISEKEDDKNGN